MNKIQTAIAEIMKINKGDFHNHFYHNNMCMNLADLFEREEETKKIIWYQNKFKKVIPESELEKIRNLAKKHREQFLRLAGAK